MPGVSLVRCSASGETKNVPTSKAERAAFVLADDEILALARWAVTIETHYGCPMDMEWARDGETGSHLDRMSRYARLIAQKGEKFADTNGKVQTATHDRYGPVPFWDTGRNQIVLLELMEPEAVQNIMASELAMARGARAATACGPWPRSS